MLELQEILALCASFIFGAASMQFLRLFTRKREPSQSQVPRPVFPQVQMDYGHIAKECCQLFLFPDSNTPCPTFYKSLVYNNNMICRKKDCPAIHYHPRTGQSMTSLMKMMKLMQGAKEILVCMYTLNLWEMSDYLCLMKRALGTRIRIITDSSTDYKIGSKIPGLIKEGIEVKMPHGLVEGEKDWLMHHKFAIIDRKLVFVGSLNWTHRGVSRNRELVLSTTNMNVITKLLGEFHSMWFEFKSVTEDDFKNLSIITTKN